MPLELAQIVQLGAANRAGAHHIDMVDDRRVHRENALHAVAEAHLANRDGLAHAGVLAGDHGAFKRLQTLFVAFPDSYVNANGIAGPELGMRRRARLCLLMNFATSAFCMLVLPSPFADARNQIGTKPFCFLARRSPAPALDFLMIAAQQHLGHFPAAKLRRPGVLRAI